MDTKSITQPAPPATRELRGLTLYKEHHDEIIHEGRGVYTVPGCGGGTYTVTLDVFSDDPRESCTCPDRAPVCKHVYAATVYRSKARSKARREQATRAAARASSASLTPLAAAL